MTEISDGALRLVMNPLGATVDKLYYRDILIADKGITIGRFANRIARGEFEIDGQLFNTPQNENGNTLHGGEGFDKRMWEEIENVGNRITFRLVSGDGDQGFPGNMTVDAAFSLADDALTIEFTASCDKDTVVNLTNHMYFNLEGVDTAPDLSGHTVMIAADGALETDENLIPTGKFLPVEGTFLDFLMPKPVLQHYDHSYDVSAAAMDKPQAVVTGKSTDLRMEIYTDCPCLQFYNYGNQLCLEPQNFPDAVHHDNFPSAVLRRGETFKAKTVYRFSAGTPKTILAQKV